MDKYNLVLDIIEHPEKYTANQLKEIMADAETNEIYTLLCKTDSTAHSQKTFDAEADWEKFATNHRTFSRRGFHWSGNRAASITAMICVSIMAVAAGIALTVSLTKHQQTHPFSETEISTMQTNVAAKDSITQPAESIITPNEPIMFENASLEDILKKVETVYNVNTVFKNKEAAELHLYYKFDPTLPLDEVIAQLNTFEQINIRYNDKTLIIY